MYFVARTMKLTADRSQASAASTFAISTTRK